MDNKELREIEELRKDFNDLADNYKKLQISANDMSNYILKIVDTLKEHGININIY